MMKEEKSPKAARLKAAQRERITNWFRSKRHFTVHSHL
jgi:hypothetical protein